MQEVTEEMIARFFKGQCTQDEALQVLLFLKKHPEHPSLLHDWDAADGTTPLSGQHSLDMYDVVAAHIKKEERRGGQLKLLWRMAAAACVVAVFISLWIRTVRTDHSTRLLTTSHAQTPEWIERQNTRDTLITIVLPDGSSAALSPGTYIRYPAAWATNGKREVHLKGEAFFRVTKNKEKPFIVYSGFISTTALGTAFRVINPEDGQHMQVRLQEGKVRVEVIDATVKDLHHHYYLLPGQEIIFTRSNKPAIIHAYKKEKMPSVLPKERSTPATVAAGTYMFNNQTLADVLDHLSAIYHVQIKYSKNEIGQMYFIGKIETSDPIEKTIQDIALLNKLSVKKQDGGYILKRKKH